MSNFLPPNTTMSYRRNDVVEAMVTTLQEVRSGSGYLMDYRIVTREPMTLDNISKLKPGETFVGVYDTSEEKERIFGATNATLTVIVEFYYMPKMGQSKAEKLNILLAEITKALVTDQTLSNTSFKIEDMANHIDIDGIYDKLINGSVTFHVTYRHGLFDPTKAIG